MSEIEKLIEKEAQQWHEAVCNCAFHFEGKHHVGAPQECADFDRAKKGLTSVADAAVQGERERATGICSRMVAWLSPSPKDGSYRRMTDKLFSKLMDAEFELRNPDEYAKAVAAEPAIRKGTPE